MVLSSVRQMGTAVVEAVRRLARGETYIHTPNASVSEISEDLVGIRVRDRLAEKELRIIAAVVRGYKNREIASQDGNQRTGREKHATSDF